MRTRLSIAILLAAASAVAVAQTPQQPTFRAEANYVRVDMYAMRDGQAVEDLKAGEIEILEDDVPQKIETFEHVKVRPAGPQESRVEPNTVRDSRAMAADPRARVFIIFLDTYHTQVDGSHNMRLPLARFLDRVIGQDDLVGVMTPEMSASTITLGRKTTVISDMMQDDWAWGRRDRVAGDDPKEERYYSCYGPEIADEMKIRRREKLSLDALEDLVLHLRGLREERKAVLTVSEGWTLVRENPRLARQLGDRVQGKREIFVGPDGKIRRDDPREFGGATMSECDADRMMLAQLDHRFRLMRLTEEANRANVSFYPVYPRGLVVTDRSIAHVRTAGDADADRRNLDTRQNSLRELASSTDGISVVNTNDIEGAMRRIVEDLTSYYLVGYYSTNSKLDGKFRAINVRSKRPGVQIRARRGYRGRTAEDLTAAAAAAGPKAPPAIANAFSAVSAVSPRSQFRIRTASWPTAAAGDKTAAAVWIVGELDYRTRKDLAWSQGAAADLVVVSSSGAEIATRSITLPASQTSFSLRVPETGGVPAGEYAVRVRVRPTADGGLPVTDVARVIVPDTPSRIGEAVMWRRGPTTGPKHAMTADPRFQRNERVRLEHATTAAGTATARLLDRAGNLLQVPVTVTDRQDESGEFRWLVAEAALAPLAAGDYAIELTLDDAKVVTAFKVIP
jgi:VWFA-related protein